MASAPTTVGDLEGEIALFLFSRTREQGGFTMDELRQWLDERTEYGPDTLSTALNNVFHKGGIRLHLAEDYALSFAPAR